MKLKFVPLMMLPLVAFAASQLTPSYSKVTTVSAANAAVEPTTATQGLPAAEANVGVPMEMRRIIVTAKQPDDAGPQSQDLSGVRVIAWKYGIQGTLVDAGTLFRWSRMPELDMTYSGDAGTSTEAYVEFNTGVTMSIAVPVMGNADRLTYTGHLPVSVDGGSAFVDLLIEGRYCDPLHP